jgi:hypothetical protein
MKKTCSSLVCLWLLATTFSSALAADVTVDSSILAGFAKRDVSGASKEKLVPATQFLGLTAYKLLDGSLSAHFYGWGRTDFADKSYNDAKTTGSLTYGYLQYGFNNANSNVRAGRLFVREGIINEQIDGLSFRAGLPMGLGLSAFGGAPVHNVHINGENSDGKGDSIYGGRVNYRYKGLLEIGLSGVYESDAPAMLTHSTGDYRKIGGDLWFTPLNAVDLIGHSSYNPETQSFAEHTYMLNVKPIRHLVLTGEFNEHHEQSYLYSWTMFSAALNPNDKSRSLGISASYQVGNNLEISTDYKRFTREFGSADRTGGDARVKYKDNAIRGGIGYHYLNAGEGFAIGANPSASYHEVRCYIMHDSKSYFTAVDLLSDIFKEKIYGQGSSWEAVTTLGYHLTSTLALSGDFSYGRNQQFTEEAKALLRLTYNMPYTGIGGNK